MPELPEVETVVRGLGKILPGQKIKKITSLHQKSLLVWPGFEAKDFEGVTVKELARRGKGIIITLSHDKTILIHLKMTGQLIYVDKTHRLNYGHPTNDFAASMPVKHTRVIFETTKGILYFNDQRLFGWVKLLPSSQAAQDPFFLKLGPEPLTKDFDTEVLWKAVSRRPKSPIKGIILDQSVVAGVGNIYADEALFLAKIHPARRGAAVTRKESDELTQAIKDVLTKGIKYRGTSITHHRTPKGSQGQMQDHLKVYQQTGKPCPDKCGGIVHRTVVAGRGTHFCPKCQK
jgi:formamidopyrimidine-DNA glycosylase